MAKKKWKKQKRKNIRWPAVIAGVAVILLAFVFSLKNLSSPFTDNQQENEAQSHQQFIERLVPHAQELQDGYGVLPSIILGQAILESNWGKSTLASKYNNLFGIKAYGDQKKVSLETKDYGHQLSGSRTSIARCRLCDRPRLCAKNHPGHRDVSIESV